MRTPFQTPALAVDVSHFLLSRRKCWMTTIARFLSNSFLPTIHHLPWLSMLQSPRKRRRQKNSRQIQQAFVKYVRKCMSRCESTSICQRTGSALRVCVCVWVECECVCASVYKYVRKYMSRCGSTSNCQLTGSALRVCLIWVSVSVSVSVCVLSVCVC
jgi:hypothetical protein